MHTSRCSSSFLLKRRLKSKLIPGLCSNAFPKLGECGQWERKDGGQPGSADVIRIAELQANIDTRLLGRRAAPEVPGE